MTTENTATATMIGNSHRRGAADATADSDISYMMRRFRSLPLETKVIVSVTNGRDRYAQLDNISDTMSQSAWKTCEGGGEKSAVSSRPGQGEDRP
jgi:hypothetical protein